jgi:toxin FitB
MASYLLDTNVLSEITRPNPSPAVSSFLLDSINLWLSVVVVYEISFGAARVAEPGRRLKLETWLESMKVRYKGRIIGIDGSIAEMAGRLRGFASLQGRSLATLDSLIAATAVINSHMLATRNVRDFEFLGIRLYDPWAG